MTTLEIPTEMLALVPAATAAEPVLDTLLLVARRADALARRHQTANRETDRRVWLRAELEILDGGDDHRIERRASAA